jgi:Spy/CpxP family protein refolding chaperone
MRKTGLLMLVGLTACLVVSNAWAQCCPRSAAPAAKAAEAEPKTETCGKAGACKGHAVFAKLNLTEGQTKEIAAICKEAQCGRNPAEGTCPKALRAKRKACMDKIMAVLTDEQKATFAKLSPKGHGCRKEACGTGDCGKQPATP